MTTPREDATARMRRVLETIIESDLLDADEWLWLDKEVRAALGVEAETPVLHSPGEEGRNSEERPIYVMGYTLDQLRFIVSDWKMHGGRLSESKPASTKRSSTESLGEWLNRQTIDAYLASPETAEALARALGTDAVRRFVAEAWVETGVSEPGYATTDEMATAILAAMRETH